MKNYAKVGATGLSTDSLFFLHRLSSARMKIKTASLAHSFFIRLEARIEVFRCPTDYRIRISGLRFFKYRTESFWSNNAN